MCIIVVKDKLTSLPQEKYLQNCFKNNPDGAGFMYVNHGRVIIDKGYMTYENFIKRYRKLCRKNNNFENKSLVMHFRIGTAGANSRENTHPYPVTFDKDVLHKTYYKTDLGVAHNGIITEYNPEVDDKTTNDTQNFIMRYIYPLYKNYSNFYKNKYIMEGINKITSSKFAFLDRNDNVYLVGNFETDDDGVKYSNSNYLPYYSYGYDYYRYYDNYYSKYYDRYYDRYYDDYGKDAYNHLLPEKVDDEKSDKDFVKNISQIDDESEVVLESDWYYSIDDKPFEHVKDKLLVYDFYYDILYEVNDMGDYEFLGNKILLLDKYGDEIIL